MRKHWKLAVCAAAPLAVAAQQVLVLAGYVRRSGLVK